MASRLSIDEHAVKRPFARSCFFQAIMGSFACGVQVTGADEMN